MSASQAGQARKRAISLVKRKGSSKAPNTCRFQSSFVRYPLLRYCAGPFEIVPQFRSLSKARFREMGRPVSWHSRPQRVPEHDVHGVGSVQRPGHRAPVRLPLVIIFWRQRWVATCSGRSPLASARASIHRSQEGPEAAVAARALKDLSLCCVRSWSSLSQPLVVAYCRTVYHRIPPRALAVRAMVDLYPHTAWLARACGPNPLAGRQIEDSPQSHQSGL
jgi:hypothetical protein